MKKRIATLLVAAMAAASLAGCGGKADPAPASKGGNETKTETAEKTENGEEAAEVNTDRFADLNYTLKWVVGGMEKQKDEEIVEAALHDKFAELGYPGINVDIISFSWGDVDAGKMATFVSSGEDYDVIWVPTWTAWWLEGFPGGAYQPWDPYLDLVPEYAAMIDDYKDMLRIAAYDAADTGDTEKYVYQVPTFKEFTQTQCAMRFNLDAARTLGIEDELRNIKNVDDLDPYLKMFQDKYPERMAVLAVDASALRAAYNGGQDSNPFAPVYNPKTDKYEIGIFQPWFEDYLSTLRRWVDAGFIPDYEVTEDWSSLNQKFGSESFLVYFNNGKPGMEAEINQNKEADGHEWGCVDLCDTFLSLDSIKGNPYCLNSKAKDPEAAAFIYMTICSNKELNNILNFGIEGTHYTLDDKEVLQKVEDSGWYPSIMPWFGNRLLCYTLPGEPEGGVGPMYEETNAAAKVFPNFGFPGPDTTLIEDPVVWDTFWGVHGAAWDQYKRIIDTGRLTDKDLQSIRDMLTKGGAEEVTEIYNLSYENWKAAK